MFHKAIDLVFTHDTCLEVTFNDGYVKEFDMASLFSEYPQLTALKDRTLFTSGKLMGFYGIIWNDDLDIEAETIYEDGKTVKKLNLSLNNELADAVRSARAKAGMSQKQVAEAAGINQADISRIECGLANPTVAILERIALALGGQLKLTIDMPAD